MWTILGLILKEIISLLLPELLKHETKHTAVDTTPVDPALRDRLHERVRQYENRIGETR